MVWFRKSGVPQKAERRKGEASGDWTRCPECGEIVFRRELERNLQVCPKCDFHFRIPAAERIRMILDENSFDELDASLESTDPLGFRDTARYRDRLKKARRDQPHTEAVICGSGTVLARRAYFAFFEMEFMGGSMGSVVGEKVTRLIERGAQDRTPVVIFTASGGARMQEGILSLMQMAKVAAALGRLRFSSVPFISVLTDPTTGGVCASMGMLGDVIVAEPGALIGFAGPRVIEETIGEALPPGYQKAEHLLARGLIDRVVPRRDLRPTLARLIDLLSPPPEAVRTA
jgi:acetyl-CoA carboxylase carboxyl transferase subunit beta